MNDRVILTGMILFSVPYAETDRRVVILTRERGKITAFAHRARKQGSALLGSTLSFCFGRFTLIEGRNAYTLLSADIDYYFDGLRKDLESTSYGCYFMELADYYGRENLDAGAMLNLLYLSLKALENPNLPNKLVRYIYEIRLMVINGDYPPSAAEDKRLGEAARYAVAYIMTSELRKLYTFVVTDEVLCQIASMQDAMRTRLIDAKLKTLSVLDSMLN